MRVLIAAVPARCGGLADALESATMKNLTPLAIALTLTVGVLHGVVVPGGPQERPHGIKARTPWTTSRVSGSPDPPPPFRVERAFPKLAFKNPLLLARAPGLNRFFVAEHQGKVFSFPIDPDCGKADLFLDPRAEVHSWDKAGKVKGIDTVYGLAFHPKFQTNRYCYVCYVLDSKKEGEQLPDGSRVSRFKVTDTDPPRIDPKSEKVLLTFLAGGHNGGDLHFGPDGYLYISTGDGGDASPPDGRNSGQDLGKLLSKILRIDVDREDTGKPYAVPADNPFLKMPGARPEIWAYGFRNPWRMSFDRASGDLWVGDVGWELWEMIYRIQRGANYGWPVMEGPQPVRPETKRGPTPILPPALALPHTEAASITGGFVYRGTRLKELAGAYVCGDWVTRKLWATRFAGDKITWHKEIAQASQRIVAFGEASDGELYLLGYEDVGTIHRLVPNEAVKTYRADFPRKLSETGLFLSVKDHTPAAGVVPFSVNAAQWADYATSERFLALPGTTTAKMYDSPIPIPGGFFSGTVFFPKDGVLAKTISLEMERGNPASRLRLETQLLHYDGENWLGYSYRWNDAQTDADLVPAAGAELALTVIDERAPGGKRKQTWHFPSRAQCLTCHNPWAGHALAFTLPQLNRDHEYGSVTDNQLRAFRHSGLITLLHRAGEKSADKTLSAIPRVRLTDPEDARANLDKRARSYLHANCSHCHQFGAGGTAVMDLRFDTPIDRTKTLEVRPTLGTFAIAGANRLTPGDPYRSVLYYRMAKLGGGRMPHIGSDFVDAPGLRLIRDWIRQLPGRQDERTLLEKLRVPNNEKYAVIKALLSSTPSALMLADAVQEGRIHASVRPQVLAAAMAHTDSQVRDLFERFVPDELRLKRLGSVIRPEQILTLKGNAERGKELFFKSAGLQCVNCHRVGETGSKLGPDLSDIGKKYTRAQILESILEPSKSIDPKYVAYLVETTDGKVHTGLLAEKNEREVVLKTTGDQEIRVPIGRVSVLAPQRNSLMPELLLRDLTAEQAADLVEFLASLR
jgi:putative heme-binding domain-containing protein